MKNLSWMLTCKNRMLVGMGRKIFVLDANCLLRKQFVSWGREEDFCLDAQLFVAKIVCKFTWEEKEGFVLDFHVQFVFKQWTPIGFAIGKENLEIVKLLLDRTAKLDTYCVRNMVILIGFFQSSLVCCEKVCKLT